MVHLIPINSSKIMEGMTIKICEVTLKDYSSLLHIPVTKSNAHIEISFSGHSPC